MNERLREILNNEGFEIVEKDITYWVLIENLLVIYILKRSDDKITAYFPIISDESEKMLLRKRARGLVEIDDDVFIKDATADRFINFLISSQILSQTKRIAEFREVNTNFTVSSAFKDGKEIKYRSNLPTERQIVDTVFRSNRYVNRGDGLNGLNLNRDDVVLDLGGNIGAFAIEIFDRVKEVHSYEPDPVNFEFLSANIRDNKAYNVKPHPLAVVGNDDPERPLYVGRVPSQYSLFGKEGQKCIFVKCEDIKRIMEEVKPSVIKANIEGAEPDVLIAISDFSSVRQIIFEYDFRLNGVKRFNTLSKYLKTNGFDVSEMKRDTDKSGSSLFLVNKSK